MIEKLFEAVKVLDALESGDVQKIMRTFIDFLPKVYEEMKNPFLEDLFEEWLDKDWDKTVEEIGNYLKMIGKSENGYLKTRDVIKKLVEYGRS